MGNITCLTYDLLHRQLSAEVILGSLIDSVTPSAYYIYDAAIYNGTGMQNAKGALAEAYTLLGLLQVKAHHRRIL